MIAALPKNATGRRENDAKATVVQFAVFFNSHKTYIILCVAAVSRNEGLIHIQANAHVL